MSESQSTLLRCADHPGAHRADDDLLAVCERCMAAYVGLRQ
jgi:hypothetical protein